MRPCQRSEFHFAYLGEADILGLLTEALTADVQLILADETGGVLADAAIGDTTNVSQVFLSFPPYVSRRSFRATTIRRIS